ncbi:MAG: cobalamin biosynthesis protein, partial [Mogibacterium sp.]|nr:cobalamin biosynthesis protein [Mogibacterium sp.]
IVGRDTESLDASGVSKAAVETVAENFSDGVFAPMLYTAIGGPVLGMAYKAVNTMDSMIGYRNDRYQWFGTAAAKLDDAVNYLPSRISALLLIAAAAIGGSAYDARRAWHIWRRDRRCHKSPNSAQTESVAAGALGLELAGDASYFGQTVHKPTIGDPVRPIEPEDIRRMNRLMMIAAVLGECLCLSVLYVLWKIL